MEFCQPTAAPRVAIFGSCVTRDLFEPAIPDVELVLYGSRSSLISACAPPVAIDEDDVRLESRFQRRCVVEDFRKTFLTRFEDAAPDRLVIDLIDERFDVLHRDGSFVTRSSEFVRAGLVEPAGQGLTPVTRRDPRLPELYRSACRAFAERVSAVLPPEHVILHRARWCTRFRDAAGVHAFPADRAAFCAEMNLLLDRIHAELVRAFGGRAQELVVGAGDALADGEHQWGLEPYHYDATYIRDARERLRSLLLEPTATGQASEAA
jgi:Family of unknown function (DUF6270)